MKKLLVIGGLLLVGISCNYSNGHEEMSRRLDLLIGDSIKFWNAYDVKTNKTYGFGWAFQKENVFMEDKQLEDIKTEVIPTDLLYDSNYFLKNDTLTIQIYNHYTFKILKLTEDRLLIKDISEIQFRMNDTILLYIKSPDQVSGIESYYYKK